ncbi:MAG: NfeD family protein [Caulobacteraceae bacterium]
MSQVTAIAVHSRNTFENADTAEFRATMQRMALKRLPIFAFLAILALTAPRVLAQSEMEAGPVLLARLDGVIGPPATHHVENAIEAAIERNAEVLILEINTPGGLETSMRDIIEEILRSPVPVVGYVSPSGGRAASAGTFILYATHIAAMAPGTNVGAATPIDLGGEEAPAPEAEKGKAAERAAASESAHDRKAINDAAAFIRSLAELRGRNPRWAERAVREGEAISAGEALRLDVIDLIAVNLDDLLMQLDGRVVEAAGAERTLQTSGRSIERVEPSAITQMLAILANPNVALLLMLLGVYGLIFEFANPGFVAPGVIGAVCLVLGLYALNQLPLNYAGLALIFLGVAFMIAEAFTPAFGILGIGGAIAFLIGAGMLIDTDVPDYQLSWPMIVLALALTGGFVALAFGVTLRAHRKRPATGAETLLGQRAEVLDWAGTSGHVWAQSERWRAEGPEGLTPGRLVHVTGVDSLTLKVAPDADAGQGVTP